MSDSCERKKEEIPTLASDAERQVVITVVTIPLHPSLLQQEENISITYGERGR